MSHSMPNQLISETLNKQELSSVLVELSDDELENVMGAHDHHNDDCHHRSHHHHHHHHCGCHRHHWDD